MGLLRRQTPRPTAFPSGWANPTDRSTPCLPSIGKDGRVRISLGNIFMLWERGTARLDVLLEWNLNRGDRNAFEDDDDGFGAECLLFGKRWFCGGKRADEDG